MLIDFGGRPKMVSPRVEFKREQIWHTFRSCNLDKSKVYRDYHTAFEAYLLLGQRPKFKVLTTWKTKEKTASWIPCTHREAFPHSSAGQRLIQRSVPWLDSRIVGIHPVKNKKGLWWVFNRQLLF